MSASQPPPAVLQDNDTDHASPPAALPSGSWLQCQKVPRAPRQASEWRGRPSTRVREDRVLSLSDRCQHVLKSADPNSTLIDCVEAGLIQHRYDFTWVDVTMAVEIREEA